MAPTAIGPDRKSTRLNSSHTEIYTLSYTTLFRSLKRRRHRTHPQHRGGNVQRVGKTAHRVGDGADGNRPRSEEHTSELQSHRDLHSFLHDALPISETPPPPHPPPASRRKRSARRKDCPSRR